VVDFGIIGVILQESCFSSGVLLHVRRTQILAHTWRILVRFQVLMAVSMEMAVFWVVALCSLVEVYQHFRGACCHQHQGDEDLMMEAASIFEMSVNFYQTLWHNISEVSHLLKESSC
jgi:hypothetical protein